MHTPFQSKILSFTQELQSGIIPASAPLNPDIENYVIKSGIRHDGRFCNIIAVSYLNTPTMHLLSDTVVLAGKKNGNQNAKPRIASEISHGARIDESRPRTRGGIVMAVESEGLVIATGSTALITDPGEGGRGFDFEGCDLDKQAYLKMALCHPRFAGKKYMSLMDAERLKLTVEMMRKYNRSHVVAKVVEGTPTAKYYEEDLHFERQERVYILEEIADPKKNKLLTFVQTVDELEQRLVNTYPDVAKSVSILGNLNDTYFHKAPQLEPALV